MNLKKKSLVEVVSDRDLSMLKPEKEKLERSEQERVESIHWYSFWPLYMGEGGDAKWKRENGQEILAIFFLIRLGCEDLGKSLLLSR